MTPEQITLVQQSFAKVAPISAQAAVLFYDRLFEVAPSVRAILIPLPGRTFGRAVMTTSLSGPPRYCLTMPETVNGATTSGGCTRDGSVGALDGVPRLHATQHPTAITATLSDFM